MHPEIRSLLGALDQAYRRRAWHGPNLRGSIRGLTAREASWRPGPGRHNIREIVVHAAYWKYAVRRRLTGGKRGLFNYRGSNWFPGPAGASEKAWRKDVALLGQQHELLREAVASLAPRELRQAGRGYKWSVRDAIQGIAFHDVYHAGQIQLLKRLYRQRCGR